MIGLHDVGPQQTSRPEFGQFHEVVASHSKVKPDLFGGQYSIDTQIGESGHIFGADSQRKSELLHNGGTGIVEGGTVDGDQVQVWKFVAPFHHRFYFFEDLCFPLAKLATKDKFANGIEVNGKMQGSRIGFPFDHQGEQRLKKLLAFAGVDEVELNGFQTNVP